MSNIKHVPCLLRGSTNHPAPAPQPTTHNNSSPPSPHLQKRIPVSRTQLQLCSTTKLHNNTSSVNRPSRIKPTTTTTLLVVRILPLLLPTAVCILSGRRNLAAKLRLVDIRLIELFVSSFKGRSTTVLLPPFSVSPIQIRGRRVIRLPLHIYHQAYKFHRARRKSTPIFIPTNDKSHHPMENWRQDRYSEVSKALKRIERRGDKLGRRIDGYSVNLSQHQHHHSRQDARQLAVWSEELARLRDMSDRLVDFRDGLYFYSNMDYVEALNEWEHEIEKICVKAEGFSSSSSLPGAKRAQETATANNRRHRTNSSYYNL